jgi:glycosyltransferase involved in cell wall biosynthesis
LHAAARLLVAALRFSPRLLYVNQAGATRIALLVGRMLRIPVMTHVRLAEDAGYVQSLGAGARELPVVVCTSHFIQSLFEGRSLDSPRKLVVMYDPYLRQRAWNGTDRIETTDPEPVFSCVGRLTRTKGQDVLLQAIGHLRREGKVVQARFIGTGAPGDPFGNELVELATELGISKQIRWQGYQEQIPSQIAPGVALICPSHSESLGRVILEAWDAGTIPVAWAGSGGPAEVIQASGAGLLYDEQNGASLAQTLERVLSLTLSDRQQMVERGRQWLLKNCDPDEYGQKMLALWESAVERS